MQRPDQVFPSSSPNPDLEVMRAAQNAAITSNEKAFPVFAKRLASRDAKEYVATARKLTTWLGSEKAYYLGARPKIVELLEIALSAFMDTFVHDSAVAESAQLLQQLVEAVVPFMHLFPENELQSRLQRVILETEQSLSRVPTNATPGNVPPQGTVTTNTPSLTVASPVNFHPQPTIPPAPGPQTSVSQIQPSLDAVKTVPGQVDAPPARDHTEVASRQTDANPSLASSTSTPQELGENISPSLPSRPQPKRARIAKLSEELIARDLDWFKSKKAFAIVDEDPGASSSKAGESLPALASDTTGIPGRSPSPKKKTARMVPSRRLPPRISTDAVRRVESGVSAFALPPPSEPQAEEPRSFDDARSAAIPEAPDLQEVSPHEELPSPEPQLVATSSNESPFKPDIPQTDHRPSSIKAPLLDGESAVSTRPLTLPSETISDRVESMDISASSSQRVSSQSPRKPESTPPLSPQALQLQSPILPPLVSAWEPPLNLDFNISQISPQQSAVDTKRRRFDDEMIIIYSAQGKTFTHTHMIDVNLNESVFAKISKWINRKFHPSEAPHGVCISLACYRLPEFFDKIKLGSGKTDIEVLTSQSSCSWPSSNRLSLHVNHETRQTVITLSPPFFLTPDQCVDISSLMKLGHNTLEIRQQGDLSEYLVVFHAHHPTRMQLAELDAVKIANERWKRFLDALSARVVPGKVLGTTPAGVVGVF